jgi:hypothetical protein
LRQIWYVYGDEWRSVEAPGWDGYEEKPLDV